MIGPSRSGGSSCLEIGRLVTIAFVNSWKEWKIKRLKLKNGIGNGKKCRGELRTGPQGLVLPDLYIPDPFGGFSPRGRSHIFS